MIGTITYILARAGWRAMNGQLKDERRRLAGAEPPAAYVSYEPRLLAGAGWYGYRISFKGGDRQMIERARYMLSERYTIRDSYEYFSDGVYVIGVLLRQRVPHYGIGGGAPAQEPDALNFYMPNGGTISLNKIGSPTVVEFEYSLDRGTTWTVWAEDGSGNRSLTLTAGQRMYLRNTSETQTGFSTSGDDYYNFAFVGDVAASGNCNSLLCKIPNIVTTLSVYCFWKLFLNCSSLTLRSGFALPATVLADSCYRAMFNSCSSLVNVPELPATVLADSCYRAMFQNCQSLVNAPELPATVLADSCYQSMFQNCQSLVNAPELPATVLADSCYRGMFQDCSSLVNAPELHATVLAVSCYRLMFKNCSSLVNTPELPAPTISEYAYYQMFYKCTQLQKVRTMMTDISASNCLYYWLYGVSPTGDFYCDQNLTIPTGASGIPSGWTRHDI